MACRARARASPPSRCRRRMASDRTCNVLSTPGFLIHEGVSFLSSYTRANPFPYADVCVLPCANAACPFVRPQAYKEAETVLSSIQHAVSRMRERDLVSFIVSAVDDATYDQVSTAQKAPRSSTGLPENVF